MFFYAQIDNLNKVIAVSQLTDQQIDPLLISIIAYDDTLLGKYWDSNTSTFVVPAAATITTPVKSFVSRLDFLHLFTDVELESLLSASSTNVAVELLITKVKVADDIELTNSRTINAVNGLESGGFLAAGRATQILSNTPPV